MMYTSIQRLDTVAPSLERAILSRVTEHVQ